MRVIFMLFVAISGLVIVRSSCPILKQSIPLKCYGPKFIPECIVYSIPAFEVLKHYLTHGVAKLDIPCHEPLHIVKTYDIRARDEYDNNMQLYVDVEIRGLTKFEINEVRLPGKRLERMIIEARFPIIHALIAMKFSLLDIHISKDTRMLLTLTSVVANIEINGRYYADRKNSKHEVFQVDTVYVHLKFQEVLPLWQSLITDDPFYDVLKNFLKIHKKSVMDQVLPVIEIYVAKTIKTLANIIYADCVFEFTSV